MSEYSNYPEFYESKERSIAQKISDPAEQVAILASIEQKLADNFKNQSKKEKQEEGESNLRSFLARILSLEEKNKNSNIPLIEEITELKKDIFSARSSIVEQSYLADWDRRDEVNEEDKNNPIPNREAFKQKHQKLQDLRERRKAYETLILRLARLETVEVLDDQRQPKPQSQVESSNEAVNSPTSIFEKEIEKGSNLITETQNFLSQLEAQKATFFTDDDSLKNSLTQALICLSNLFVFEKSFQNNTDFFSKQLDKATDATEYAQIKEKLEQGSRLKENLTELEKKLKSFFSNLIQDIERSGNVENAIKAFTIFNLPENASSTITQELRAQLVDFAFKLIKSLLQNKFDSEKETTPSDQIENLIQDLINEYFSQNFASFDQAKVESFKQALEPKIKSSFVEEKNSFEQKKRVEAEEEAKNAHQQAETEKAKQKWTEPLEELRNKENELANLLKISDPELITSSADISLFEGHYKQLMDLINQIKSQIVLGSGFLEEAKQERSPFVSDPEYVKSKNSFESEIQIAKSKYQFALGRLFTLAAVLPSSGGNDDQRKDLALLGLSFSELKKEGVVSNNYLLDIFNKKMPSINSTLDDLIADYQADPSKEDLFHFFQYFKTSDVYELARGITRSLEDAKDHVDPEGQKFFNYSLREAYSNRIYYEGPRANNKAVQSKMEAKRAEFGLDYDLRFWRALLSDEPNASKIRTDRDMFVEGQTIFHELAGVGLYDVHTINRDALMCYKMQLLAGSSSEPANWGSAGGLANEQTFQWNEKFNLTGLFNIDQSFNSENQTSASAGKLQQVISRMVEYMRDPNYKFFAGNGPYDANLITEFLDKIFEEKKALFENDPKEIIDFYKEMILFKASRDNLFQEYAIEALGKEISALKGNIQQEPRPHGLLMSMIYQLVRGKEVEAHTAMLEIIDLSSVIDGYETYDISYIDDGSGKKKPLYKKKVVPGFASPPSLKTSSKKPESFQAVKDNEQRYLLWLVCANNANGKIAPDRFAPSAWNKDFPSISWFTNQIHEKSTDPKKMDKIVSSAQYVKAESSLAKIIDTAITGIKPEDITDAHVGALLNTINSQFSILMALTGKYETGNPLNYTIELALASYKVLIKNILINTPGNRSTSIVTGLDKEGRAYESNFDHFYALIETSLGVDDLRLKDCFSKSIREYLGTRKESFKQYNNTRDLISRALEPNLTDQFAARDYNKFIWEHMPWLTPWARHDDKGRFLGLYETESVIGRFGTFSGTKDVQFAVWDDSKKELRQIKPMQHPEEKAKFFRKQPQNPLSYKKETIWSSSYQGEEKS